MTTVNRELRLICNNCGQDIPRHTAGGLLIGNDSVQVKKDFIQVCTSCGHKHPPGDWLRFYMAPVEEVS